MNDDTAEFRAFLNRQLEDAPPREHGGWVITVTYGLVIGLVIGYLLGHWLKG